LLEATGKSEGDNHYSHTDDGRRYRKPDYEPWKGPLRVKSDAAGYKSGYIHGMIFVHQK